MLPTHLEGIIIEKLRRKVASGLGISLEGVRPDQDLKDLGLDSFGFAEIISDLESEYAFSFTEDELVSKDLNRISTISRIVSQKASAKQ